MVISAIENVSFSYIRKRKDGNEAVSKFFDCSCRILEEAVLLFQKRCFALKSLFSKKRLEVLKKWKTDKFFLSFDDYNMKVILI